MARLVEMLVVVPNMSMCEYLVLLMLENVDDLFLVYFCSLLFATFAVPEMKMMKNGVGAMMMATMTLN